MSVTQMMCDVCGKFFPDRGKTRCPHCGAYSIGPAYDLYDDLSSAEDWDFSGVDDLDAVVDALLEEEEDF